jgi:hypothetical protein
METPLYAGLSRRPWNQFHLQQNATIARLRTVLENGYTVAAPSFGSVGTQELVLGFFRGLDVLTQTGELTQHGKRLQTLHAVRPELLGEAVHIWLRCHALTTNPPRFTLAYDGLCNLLYSLSQTVPTRFDSDSVLSDVRTYLRARTGITDELIAFSQNSIKGALFWLGETAPAVVTKEKTNLIVTIRTTAPSESVLWVLSFFAGRVPLLASDISGAEFIARLLLAETETVNYFLRSLFLGSGDATMERLLQLPFAPVAIGDLPKSTL